MQNEIISKYGISANGLKLLALIFMITDHVGAVLLPQYRILRYIGRLSFPIYCFLITEGVRHTHNIYAYGARLLGFALMSEIPYDLAIHGQLFDFNEQNVFFTLLIGMVVVYGAMILPDLSQSLFVCILGMGMALLIKSDYTAYGVIMMYCFYYFKDKPLHLIFSVGLTNYILGLGGTGSQKWAVLALIPIFLYSGKKKWSIKDNNEIKRNNGDAGRTVIDILVQYMFYAAYPLHLIILYALQCQKS